MASQHQIALDKSITPIRMSTCLNAANGDRDKARELYLWDRDLAVAFLADLAILEVALRNAMAQQLEIKWGHDWYSNLALPLDDRTLKALNLAWKQIKDPQKTSGKLIAQCTFGFWRRLLDKGDYYGIEPRRVRCDYEILWRGVLDKAFPGGRQQARKDQRRWNREYALSIVGRVNDLRNRVAHHEPLINGIPLNGQKVRVSAQQLHEDTMRLAAMLDRDLHSFLAARSKVPAVLKNRPV